MPHKSNFSQLSMRDFSVTYQSFYTRVHKGREGKSVRRACAGWEIITIAEIYFYNHALFIL